VYKK
jgi:hypothetical protein